MPLLNALNDDRTQFGELIGSPVPDGWPEFPEAIGFTLKHSGTRREADRAWSMQFFVDPATGRLLGSGGFAAPPVDRTVEIGYESGSRVPWSGVRARCCPGSGRACRRQRRGRYVIAHTLPGPNPSTGVLVSLGFEHVDDQEDPEVGTVWEWRWTRLPVE